jgi:TatD DNase family protein
VRTLAERFADVFCSVGTQAGLDYHYDKAPRADQQDGLRRHIAAARITGLPLVIHARDADADMAAILAEEFEAGAFPAVLHCFSSGRGLAETGLKLGFTISFSGILTFKTADALRAIARDVPADRILVETDAPYLAPAPHRGKRNEPAYVAHTAAVLAEVRGVSRERIAEETSENFFRLFSKVPRP